MIRIMKRTSIQHAAVFVEGYLAGITGNPRKANPHKLGSVSALWWFESWDRGKYKRTRKSFELEKKIKGRPNAR